ncbi:MAG TPA: SRPBCC family protein [Candidatus Saccharimonadales bacterium]|nr:SRPBCC family protein [Candidatus Saccharimonadales bacterium]
MIKKILIILGVIIVIFIVIVALQPADFRVVRSASMTAPAPAVFAQVNDFHNWDAWSPWAKLDPNMKTTFEGPPAGPGAIYSWTGDRKVGAGRMAITESKPAELVRIKLDFLKPFEASNVTEFSFKPDGNNTSVTWSMTGRNNFMAKAFCLFMNMDKMVGGDFEKGLAQMKKVVEAPPKQST